jgi:hypothetical protein
MFQIELDATIADGADALHALGKGVRGLDKVTDGVDLGGELWFGHCIDWVIG